MKNKLAAILIFSSVVGLKAQNWNNSGDNSTTGKVLAKEYSFPLLNYDFSKAPRTQISPMSIKVFDDYNTRRPGGSSPDNNAYGTLLSINGYVNHWESNIYFGANTKKMYFRTSTWTGGTSENGTLGGFHSWRTLLDSKSDVNSSGNLQLAGNGTHYLAGGSLGIGTSTPSKTVEIASGQNDGQNFPVLRLTSKDVNAVNDQPLGEIQFYNKDADGAHISSYVKALAAETYGRKGQLTFGTSSVNSQNAVERMRIDEDGNVGIGTIIPRNKNESNSIPTMLHVKNTNATGNVEVARFEGGNDSDNTAAIVRINHANDRGLYLKGGRRYSDRSFGEIGVIGTTGNLEMPSIIMDDNGIVGVGGDIDPAGGISPDKSRKLYVDGGLTIKSGKMFSLDKNYYVHAYSQYESTIKEARFLNYGYYGHRWTTRMGVGMVLLGNNNRVGIGITDPSEKFEVYNSVTTPGVISLRSSRNDASHVDVGKVMAKQGTTEVSRIGMPRAGGTYTGYLTFWTKETNSSVLKESMRINEKGNVGIGTKTTGTHRLAVDGSIGAREIKVETTAWPDYVFEKEYNLTTLSDVEKHIKEKGHLPNIPSAKEVEKEGGIELGEMNKKLLEKIEELTLYTIEQEKEIKKLRVDTMEQERKMKRSENNNKKLLTLVEKLEERITKLEKE